jgi:N-acetylglutamate synthase/N-acetylornithine aminotransferase
LVVNLHAGSAATRVWTTDLTEGYVRINAGYRS